MSIQTIVDNAVNINIDKRRIVAQSISRSGHLKTIERSPVPYTFTINMHDGLTYSTNRAVLEDLDTQDTLVESNISLNNNTGMNYLTSYQGDLSGAQQDQLTLNAVSGANIYVNASGITGNTSGYAYLFKKGDYIQPEGNTSTYRYPYQVTSDIAFSTGANVTVPVHRPVLSQTGVALTSGAFRIGNEVRFHVKAVQNPTYTVVPYDRVVFDGEFVLSEIIL